MIELGFIPAEIENSNNSFFSYRDNVLGLACLVESCEK